MFYSMIFFNQKSVTLFMHNESLRVHLDGPSPAVKLHTRVKYGGDIKLEIFFCGLSVENFVKKSNNLRNVVHPYVYKSINILK